jgi:hypothetical protein
LSSLPGVAFAYYQHRQNTLLEVEAGGRTLSIQKKLNEKKHLARLFQCRPDAGGCAIATSDPLLNAHAADERIVRVFIRYEVLYFIMPTKLEIRAAVEA